MARMRVTDGQEEFYLRGYKLNYVKLCITLITTIITLGLFGLFLYWKPDWLVWALYSESSDIHRCSRVLIKDQYNRYFLRTLFNKDVRCTDLMGLICRAFSDEAPVQIANFRCFTFHKCLYMFSPSGGKVERFPAFHGLLTRTWIDQQLNQGLCDPQVTKRRDVYGNNVLDINPKSIPYLLFTEIIHPFYLFQVFSVTVWMLDDYVVYSVCIVVLSVFSIFWSMLMTYSQQKKLLRMTKCAETIDCVRNGDIVSLWQDEVVPGDVVALPASGCHLNFDCVLLSGTCIANESMLTGESVPVTKTPYMPNDDISYSPKLHSKHTLFSGTNILQCRNFSQQKCLAMVSSTSFYTSKGELVRAILYPKPMSFKLFLDAMIFVGALVCVAMVGLVYSLVLMVSRGLPLADIILKPLDIITIAVPPALPAALNIGIVYAQRRLRSHRIFCISPQRIDVAGSVDTVCFDKTGTLTEDELSFNCVVPVNNSGDLGGDVSEVDAKLDRHLLVGLSSCHSLTNIDGKLAGDPIDLETFRATGWSFNETGGADSLEYGTLAPSTVSSPKTSAASQTEVAIVRQFAFTSEMQRMGVIVRDASQNHFEFFVKGSPEKVASLCSSVPHNFSKRLEDFTSLGFRVLAIAHKPIIGKLPWHKVQKIAQSDLEKDLQLLGLLVFNNQIKPASRPSIVKLQAANIRTIMVTGDNLATAVAVARQSRLIENSCEVLHLLIPEDVRDVSAQWHDSSPFAMTGTAFECFSKGLENTEVFRLLLERTVIYARMSPEQKACLVEMLQKSGRYVAMCGDGANDCGALKAAHVGISLSELEASAASPFTSAKADISCVDILIREGRASLVNSFSTFKFMGLYSLIQFTSIVILYWFNSTLGDYQFLYIDMVIITSLMVTMGRTEPNDKLSKKRPPVRLFKTVIFVSLFSSIIVQLVAQIGVLILLSHKSWYEPLVDPEPDPYDNVLCDENSSIFIISGFLYIVSALAFSSGPPFRKYCYTNWMFVGVVFVLASCQVLILFHRPNWTLLEEYLEVVHFDDAWFKAQILMLILGAAAFVVLLEFEVISTRSASRKTVSANLYREQVSIGKSPSIKSGQFDSHFEKSTELHPERISVL